MPTSSHPPEALAELSPPVAAYVEATNSFDLGGLLATFAESDEVEAASLPKHFDNLETVIGQPLAIRHLRSRPVAP